MNDLHKEKEPSVELRVQDLLLAYLRQWRLIALCVVVACTIAWGITFFCMTPMYQASATIYVSNYSASLEEDPNSNKAGLNSSDLTASIHLVKGYMTVAKSEVILEKAAVALNNRYTTQQLRRTISMSQINDTIIFAVRASSSNAYEAMCIADAVAAVLAEEGPKIIGNTSAKIIDTAQLPTAPYSPDYSSNILTGAMAGLLLAVAYVTIMFLKDTRIKDENDLTDMFDLPILGRIPNFDDHITGARYVDSETEKGGAEA